MPMVDPFAGDGFSSLVLTTAINEFPNMYGRVQDMGLFREVGVTTREVAVERYQGTLVLLPTKPVGSPGTEGKTGKRDIRSFTIPHIPHDDAIMPEEVQGVRQFGSENQLEGQQARMALKLREMANKHAITRENLYFGALKGIVLDADGSVLIDFFTEWGITPKVISFTADPKAACLEMKRHMEDNLLGEISTGAYCLCSEEFFDGLTNHADVKEAYARWRDGEALREDMRSGFRWQGVTFEEYRGKAQAPDGSTTRFIAANEAHFFPMGTQETFLAHYAPADFNEAVNTIGLKMYAKQEPKKFGRGWDLHTQSNPLPMCHKPALLVKGTFGI